MKRFVIAAMMTMTVLIVSARVSLWGKVTTVDGEPIIGVVVKVFASNGDLIAYGTTQSTGDYKIDLGSESVEVMVSFTGMSYKEKEIVVTDFSTPVNITMHEAPFQLKEVTIKTPPVRTLGDTIVYAVDAFRKASDQTIEDVIKQLPGIIVADNGRIMYNGEPINKFYIEGLDLLSGRYALATKNISPTDVQSVSVYENHQPKRVLQEVEISEKAAINLTLKKKRMLRPIGNVTGGVGRGNVEVGWKSELFSMLVSPDNQTLISAKANNCGTNYAQETQSLVMGGNAIETEVYKLFPLKPLGVANLPPNRYEENTSVLTSVNSIFKLKDTLTLNVVADYTKEDSDYRNSSEIEYFGADGKGSLTVFEKDVSHLSRHGFNVRLKVENNASALFYQDELKISGQFNNNDYLIDRAPLMSQTLRNKDVSVSNRFNFALKHDNRLWEFASDISVASTPVNCVSVGMLDADSLEVLQTSAGFAFVTHERTALSWLLRKYSTFGVRLDFKSRYDRIDSEAVAKVLAMPSINSISGYKIETTAVPYYQYKKGRVTWRTEVPIKMYNMRYDDAIDDTIYNYNRPAIEWNTSFTYRFPNNLVGILKLAQSQLLGDISNFVTHPIAVSYKQWIVPGSQLLSKRASKHVTLSMNYRNALVGFFWFSRLLYGMTENNVLNRSEVGQLQLVQMYQNYRNKSRVSIIETTASKSFYDIHTVVSLSGNVQLNKRHTRRDDETYDVNVAIYEISGDISSSLWNKQLELSAECRYMRSVQDLGFGSTAIDEVSAAFNVSVFPFKWLEIYAKSSLKVSELAVDVTTRNFFLDGGLRLSRGRFDVGLSVTNITNRRSYSYRRFIEYDTYTYNFCLRPIEAIASVRYNF